MQQAQRATGCREMVWGLEPTGTYPQAVATFLETQGVHVVLLSSSVAYWNRRTQDGTWDKHDRATPGGRERSPGSGLGG